MNNEQTLAKGGDSNPLARHFTLTSLLAFAFPTIFMMIFSGLCTIVDTMFVARFVGTDALSAINIVTPVINLIVGLGGMLATGGSAIVARKMGGGESQAARQDFTLIILTAAVLGLILACCGLPFREQIILGLGASPRLLPYARDYLTILLLFAPANILQVVFANLFVTAGKPGLGMGLGLAAGLTNAALDFIFIVPLNLGIGGAALATSIGYTIPTLAGILFFWHNKKGPLHFSVPSFKPRVIAESCLNGSSEMVSQLSTAVTTFLFNTAMMRLLGEDGVAAITIIIYSQFLLTTLYIGFSMGVAPVISYHFGSGNHDQLKRLLRLCLVFITTASLTVFALSYLGGPCLVGVFAPAGTPVYDIARLGFTIFPVSFLFCGFNIFASAFFTALSNGKISAAISFLRTFVFLTLGLLTLPLLLGATGIWLAVPLAEAVTFLLALYFLRQNRGKYHYS